MVRGNTIGLTKSVKDDLAQMALGNEGSYTEKDPTASMQLQFAQQLLGANPRYHEMLAKDPLFQDRLGKWRDNRLLQAKQEENKVVGRLGIQPGPGAG